MWNTLIAEEGAQHLSYPPSKLYLSSFIYVLTVALANPPPPLPSDTPKNLISILHNQYPIQRTLLPYLNKYDITSLRATCRILRSEFPSGSTRLGGWCHAHLVPAEGCIHDLRGFLTRDTPPKFNDSELFNSATTCKNCIK